MKGLGTSIGPPRPNMMGLMEFIVSITDGNLGLGESFHGPGMIAGGITLCPEYSQPQLCPEEIT